MSKINVNNIEANDASTDITVTTGGSQSLLVDTNGKLTVAGNLSVNGNNYPSAGPLSNRNLIINGAMQVAQRGTQTTQTSGYTACDRWQFNESGATVVTTSQDTDVPTGEGFANSLKVDVTSAVSSPGASDYAFIRTKFEGQDLQAICKGTSNAKQVTLSFWVKSAKTGTHIAELYDHDNSRQVSKAYSITTANTWQNVTLQFPADTTGAFDDDANNSLQVTFWLMGGSNYTSGTLNTSWAASTSADRVAGQVNVVDSTSNNFYLTGVQLEVGDTATPFEHRSFGDELARCQRYFYKTLGNSDYAHLLSQTDTYRVIQYPLPTTMRAIPSISNVNVSANYAAPAPNVSDGRKDALYFQWNGVPSGGFILVVAGVEADAEL